MLKTTVAGLFLGGVLAVITGLGLLAMIAYLVAAPDGANGSTVTGTRTARAIPT